MSEVYRPEHPRPQFRRDNWLNLNGKWKFTFDFSLSGEEKSWQSDASQLTGDINVPFCPESRLSGVGYTDFIPCIWYSRTFEVPPEWSGMRVFLNIGAADYDCRAWVNGKSVGRHYGTGSSFSFDMTEAIQSKENLLVVCVKDEIRSGVQPVGKQSRLLHSHGCDYTRTTGIWQTVWLEARPLSFIESVRIIPGLDEGKFTLIPTFNGDTKRFTFRTTVNDGICSEARCTSGVPVQLDIENPHPWSPVNPYLYDMRFEILENGKTVDLVHSYAGLRKFVIDGNRFYLNNEPIFLRLVLDQGFYPEGIWTAPSDDELRGDIERSMTLGFNGARLHQKVFEERFHYWADKLGYLTWGEFCDWGMDFRQPQSIHNHQREWREVVMRDMNHPSIIAWTPFNESSGGATADFEAHRRAVSETYELTKALDPTRPVNDASGWVHVQPDIYTMHNYEQNPEKFAQTYASVSPDARGKFCVAFPKFDIGYKGQPFVIDEYGGTFWDLDAVLDSGWGYGQRPKDTKEVLKRIEGLTSVLTDHPNIAGFCYTQLTDVEQEKNGLYTYDRRLKFDQERLRKAFSREHRF
ncbi:MAG: sugar-binding domain-containing protein [Armatimonadota bacterium]